MGVVQKEYLLDAIAEKYPEFTRKSLKKLVNYGLRKLIHELNLGSEVFINGSTNKQSDNILFCKDVSYKSHIEKMNTDKLKRLNRKRVNKFNNKE